MGRRDACERGLTDAEAFADDFVLDDRRSTVAAEPADREQLAERLRAQHEAGAVRSTETIAIRGERFGLFRLRSEYESSRIEFLTTLEVDDLGRAVHAAHFDADDMAAAANELSRTWAATLPGDVLPLLRLAADYERVAYTPDLAGEVFAGDAVFTDHRPVGFGVLDINGYRNWHGQRADEGQVTGFAPEVLAINPHILLFSNITNISAGDGASWEEFFFQLLVARDRTFVRLEVFGADQRAAALARAAELAES